MPTRLTTTPIVRAAARFIIQYAFGSLLLAACDGDVKGARPSHDAAVEAGADAMADLDAQAVGDAGADATVPEPEPQRVCSEDGWCWVLPAPQGHDVHDVWARSADDVWAAGDHGLLLHFDGDAWTRTTSVTDLSLRAVFGTATNNVWAAGQDGVVLHFDGTAWHVLDALPPGPTGTLPRARTLHALWSDADDNVWFVGDAGRVIHFDGNGFTIVDVGTTQALRSIWGDSNEDVWIVGSAGTCLHFDGAAWSTPTSIAGGALFSVRGRASDDVWAAGVSAALHWDGDTWTDFGSDFTGRARAVIPVHAFPTTAADAGVTDPVDGGTLAPGPVIAWAFGEAGRVWSFRDGAWQSVASNVTTSFFAATDTGAGDLLAVGERGAMQRWFNGARMNLSQGSGAIRLSLVVDQHGELWSTGDEVLRRVNDRWLRTTTPTPRALFGAWSTATTLWAVGTAGTVLNWSGTSWSDVTPLAAGDLWLRAVHGTDSSLWIVGQSGTALHHSGATWATVDTSTNDTLRDVWSITDDDAWAVGDDATVLHWDGEAWSASDTGLTSGVLHAVWARASDDVWIVGSGGRVLHFDGTSWTTQRSDGPGLHDITGTATELWAVGAVGTILHFDGTTWSAQHSGTRRDLHAIVIEADGTLWAAGTDGSLLSKKPAASP